MFTRERRPNNASDALEERAEPERVGQPLNPEQFDNDDWTQSDVRRYTNEKFLRKVETQADTHDVQFHAGHSKEPASVATVHPWRFS